MSLEFAQVKRRKCINFEKYTIFCRLKKVRASQIEFYSVLRVFLSI